MSRVVLIGISEGLAPIQIARVGIPSTSQSDINVDVIRNPFESSPIV
ncbi:MAG TPA: hypothetical protein PKJ41_16630 [Bryobacteraceae bacterium]|nr:hypothetical protein [Bryobacteraceae bacterium]